MADGNEAVFAAFSLGDGDEAFGAVEVVEGEFAKLAGAQAAGV